MFVGKGWCGVMRVLHVGAARSAGVELERRSRKKQARTRIEGGLEENIK